MAELINPFELDQAWLKQRIPDADENMLESFAERVAIKCANGENEYRARLEALQEMNNNPELYPACFW